MPSTTIDREEAPEIAAAQIVEEADASTRIAPPARPKRSRSNGTALFTALVKRREWRTFSTRRVRSQANTVRASVLWRSDEQPTQPIKAAS